MKKLLIIVVLTFLFSSCVKQQVATPEQKQTAQPQITATETQEEMMYEFSESIQINQVGYLSNKRKVFWVTDDAKEYSLVDVSTQEIVFSGEIIMIGMDEAIGSTSGYGDFSAMQQEGEYFIAIDGKFKSSDFVISEKAYEDLSESMLKMLYYQRCGIDILEEYAGEYSHKACHDSMGMVWDTNIAVDGTGGWHDAGDYGKYTVPCVSTVSDLLFAYGLYPLVFSDDTNIPESGNGIPDVLDEARVGLEWLQKMQRDDGGVYHKYTSPNFCGMIMPQNDYLGQYAIGLSPTATASFCAIMAKAADVFQKIDIEFANSCRDAAILSYEFLKANPDMPQFENPDGVTTGDYRDTSDQDERYWAAVEMYLLTDDINYLDDAKAVYTRHTALFWSDTLELYDVGFKGTFSYLTSDKADRDSEFYKKLYTDTIDTAEKLVKLSTEKAFNVAMNKEDYIWGSNMVLTNRANVLLMVNEIKPDTRYIETAQAHLDYLMGTNALSQSYITGYGQKSIKYPHHRPSVSDRIKEPIPGMVSGGPNASLQDTIAQTNFDDTTPAALCFSDESASYSMNEVTTYWNSSALFCVSGLISNK